MYRVFEKESLPGTAERRPELDANRFEPDLRAGFPEFLDAEYPMPLDRVAELARDEPTDVSLSSLEKYDRRTFSVFDRLRIPLSSPPI